MKHACVELPRHLVEEMLGAMMGLWCWSVSKGIAAYMDTAHEEDFGYIMRYERILYMKLVYYYIMVWC